MNVARDVLRPDARLRAPKRALPRGAVDCHAHIFDRFERYPLAPGRKYSPPLCPREAWLDDGKDWQAHFIDSELKSRINALGTLSTWGALDQSKPARV